MTTFADLGIPFPLFEAPTKEAGDYIGLSMCSLSAVRRSPAVQSVALGDRGYNGPAQGAHHLKAT
jgi:hypothetical protein